MGQMNAARGRFFNLPLAAFIIFAPPQFFLYSDCSNKKVAKSDCLNRCPIRIRTTTIFPLLRLLKQKGSQI